MSRLYRIKVSESVERLIHVEDGVASDLELLPVLAPERMRELLADELAARGFVQEAGTATLHEADGISISVELLSGRVTARVESGRNVALTAERDTSTRAYDRTVREKIEEQLQKEASEELAEELAKSEAQLQKEATARLETALRSIRGQMDQVVNRVTMRALKERAAQLGEIEELTENAETGELTIKVKV